MTLLFALVLLALVLGFGVLLLGAALLVWLLARVLWLGVRAVARRPEPVPVELTGEDATETVLFSTWSA